MGKNDGVENIGDDVMMKIWEPMASFLIYGWFERMRKLSSGFMVKAFWIFINKNYLLNRSCKQN